MGSIVSEIYLCIRKEREEQTPGPQPGRLRPNGMETPELSQASLFDAPMTRSSDHSVSGTTIFATLWHEAGSRRNTDFHFQPALLTVGCMDATSMQPDGAVCN